MHHFLCRFLRNIDIQVSSKFKTAIGDLSYAPVGKIGLQMKRRFWEDDHAIYGGHVYFDDPDVGSISLPSTGWFGPKGVILGYYNFGPNAAKISAMSLAGRQAFAAAAGQKVFCAVRRERGILLLDRLGTGFQLQHGRLGDLE